MYKRQVYGATKGAVNSMTATLAKELAPYGIQVNAVAPGFITTEMIEAIPEEKKEEYLKNIPMGRLGKVEEVAEVVNMLCSDVASYITGPVSYTHLPQGWLLPLLTLLQLS